MSFWETQKAQKGALMRLNQGPEGARPLCPPTASPFRELRHTLSWSIVVTGMRPAHTMDAGRPRADALGRGSALPLPVASRQHGAAG